MSDGNIRGLLNMAASKAQLQAQARYNKAHTKGVYFKFNTTTDADIISFLDTVTNKQGFIKNLIRDYITKAPK